MRIQKGGGKKGEREEETVKLSGEISVMNKKAKLKDKTHEWKREEKEQEE